METQYLVQTPFIELLWFCIPGSVSRILYHIHQLQDSEPKGSDTPTPRLVIISLMYIVFNPSQGYGRFPVGAFWINMKSKVELVGTKKKYVLSLYISEQS